MTGSELKLVMDAERAGIPFLILRGVDGELILIRMDTKVSLTVGRRPANEVSITWDDEVSRLHAEFHRVGEDWTISDDGLSRNGTIINGSRISSRRRLSDGDTLRFGETTVVFRWRREATSPRTSPAGDIPTVESLTPIQRKILIALARPYRHGGTIATPATNEQIAAEVHMSVDAVKGHLRLMARRFGVGELPKNQKRTAVVERALRWGLISERDL
jgi:pSer/pThr/pTyr-binding forkhead associated (FHA) protein